MNKNKNINKNRFWKNFFIVTTVLFLSTSIILGTIVYLNADYILFKTFMTSSYLYTDLLDKLIKENVGIESKKSFGKYFDNLAIDSITDRINKTKKDYYTYQYNPTQFKEYKNYRTEKAAQSYVKELTKDTVYLKLTNFTEDTWKFFSESIPTIKNYKNFVLDLRDNGGGDIKVSFDIADTFIEKGNVMLFEKRRHISKKIIAQSNKKLNFENIIIIQNKNTASASEQLITMLTSTVKNVKTIGTKTYGKYIGQTRISLLKGFYVKATTLEWTGPDGKKMPKGGIPPEYLYEDENIIEFILQEILSV